MHSSPRPGGRQSIMRGCPSPGRLCTGGTIVRSTGLWVRGPCRHPGPCRRPCRPCPEQFGRTRLALPMQAPCGLEALLTILGVDAEVESESIAGRLREGTSLLLMYSSFFARSLSFSESMRSTKSASTSSEVLLVRFIYSLKMASYFSLYLSFCFIRSNSFSAIFLAFSSSVWTLRCATPTASVKVRIAAESFVFWAAIWRSRAAVAFEIFALSHSKSCSIFSIAE